jgi:isoquinoline 1-oxidoreductase alpha subunit
MIMAVVALLAAKANPSEDDVATAITNVCRCGTYPRVKRAIRALASTTA